MFFCPKCSNLYSFSKNIKKENISDDQTGGKRYNVDDIIEKIMKNDLNKIEFDTFDDEILVELQKSPDFKKLTVKNKDMIYNFINDKINKKTIKTTKVQSHMYFICKNCGNHETIPENLMILSKSNTTNYYMETNFNPNEYLEMNIYPHTRLYTCVNEKCSSHNDATKKSAIFMRLPNSFRVRYICEECKTAWMAS